jgi:NADPH-dependent glutamate synthase beta subunit-like oxidoreductase
MAARATSLRLIIGAGPIGPSAAYHFARRGHVVEVRDAGAEPGGMMRYGIRAYRLPREVLAAESPGLRHSASRSPADIT